MQLLFQAVHFSVKPDSLADEKIDISVHDLPPVTKITLRCEVTLSKKFHFSAFGFFYSDYKCSILLSENPSFGGTYTGSDPMGLIWSLTPEKGERMGLRFIPEVLVPSEYKLFAFKGHHEDVTNADMLAETTIRRHWFSDSVSYKHVRHGRLRGIIFAPKDKSRKYPGILDVYGSGGGLTLHRSSLLAGKGFVTFALAFFRYDDLKPTMGCLDLDYFVDAVNYLSQHESVDEKCGLGGIGISKGADLMVDVAALCRNIKALVIINSVAFSFYSKLFYKGHVYRLPLTLDWIRAYLDENKYVVTKFCNDIPFQPEAMTIPLHLVNGKVLIFVSNDDQQVPSRESARLLERRMKEFGRGDDCIVHTYDGAGHTLEPAYMPYCIAGYMAHLGGHCVAFGGAPSSHKDAQLHFWSTLIDFFKTNLKSNS